jgi:hypothetical protein
MIEHLAVDDGYHAASDATKAFEVNASTRIGSPVTKVFERGSRNAF